MQQSMTLLDDENLTVEEAAIEDNQQVLIEGIVSYKEPNDFKFEVWNVLHIKTYLQRIRLF